MWTQQLCKLFARPGPELSHGPKHATDPASSQVMQSLQICWVHSMVGLSIVSDNAGSMAWLDPALSQTTLGPWHAKISPALTGAFA